MHLREAASIEAELTPPIELSRPGSPALPLIFSSPHSGRIYPKRFLEASRLDALSLRRSEDCFIDELFAHCVNYGASFLQARFPRAYLDVNREPYELDPKLIAGDLPDYANSGSTRVAGGLGTVARVVTENEAIYRRPLALSAVLTRIEKLYNPYHAALRELVVEANRVHGVAYLFDCHSMPSMLDSGAAGDRFDIVVGDRFGTSAGREPVELVRDVLQSAGYRVVLNKPYAGGYITEFYGRPRVGVHAVQIEINRGLYMNEATLEKTSGFDCLQQDLEALTRVLAHRLPHTASFTRFAAE